MRLLPGDELCPVELCLLVLSLVSFPSLSYLSYPQPYRSTLHCALLGLDWAERHRTTTCSYVTSALELYRIGGKVKIRKSENIARLPESHLSLFPFLPFHASTRRLNSVQSPKGYQPRGRDLLFRTRPLPSQAVSSHPTLPSQRLTGQETLPLLS